MDSTSISSNADPELFIAQVEFTGIEGHYVSKREIYSCCTVIASRDFKTGQGYYTKTAIHEHFSRIKKGNIE